ncbi:MAG: amidohydrolase family protein [Planctomycetota bacterium]|jgi:imidazolonepropionase-like amidohydrolase
MIERKQAASTMVPAAMIPVMMILALTTAVSTTWAAAPGNLAFRVGKVVTMDDADRVINNAVVLVSGGKIHTIGKASEVQIPQGYRVIEAHDKWLAPGIVDCHNHTSNAFFSDLNDSVYLTNPGLRTLETIDPENSALKNARAGGVTTVLMIPGSGTNMSGFGTVSKTAGSSVDSMVMRAPGSLKIAQAGNPEWYWYGVGRSFMNYNTRQTLEKAKAYHEAWSAFESGQATERPEFSPIFDDFRGLFNHDYPASVHTQIYQVVMTTIDMLANKLDIRTVLDHSTFDGYKTARLAVEADVYTINGPRQYHFDRATRKMNGNAARWWQGGMRKLGINTDAPVIPQEELPYQAAMACWYGWQPYPALRGLTRVPAEALMVEDRVGTIETGKDADFGIWTGDPIDPRSSCEITVVDGKIVYEAAKRRRF